MNTTSMAGKTKKAAAKKAARTNSNATKLANKPSKNVKAIEPATKKAKKAVVKKEQATCIDLRRPNLVMSQMDVVLRRNSGALLEAGPVEMPLDTAGFSLAAEEIDLEIHEEEERVELGGLLNPRKKFIELEEFSMENIHSASIDLLFGNTDSTNPLQRLIEQEERVAREIEEEAEEKEYELARKMREKELEPKHTGQNDNASQTLQITSVMQSTYEAHLPDGPAPEDKLICKCCKGYSNNLNKKGCCPGCVEEKPKEIEPIAEYIYQHYLMIEDEISASIQTAPRTAVRIVKHNHPAQMKGERIFKASRINNRLIEHITGKKLNKLDDKTKKNQLTKIQHTLMPWSKPRKFDFKELRRTASERLRRIELDNKLYHDRTLTMSDVKVIARIQKTEDMQYLISRHGLTEIEAAVAVGVM